MPDENKVKDVPAASDKLKGAAAAVGLGISAAATKAAAVASEVAEGAASAWAKHAPSKEAVVGTAVLGVVAPAVIGREGVEAAGTKTIAAVSDTVSNLAGKVRNASPWALVGGAIVGVGAVAAAPFTGGGSVLGGATLLTSLAGAAGAATAAAGVGAVAGVAISNASNERTRTKGFKEGREAATAEVAAKLQALQEHLVRASECYKDQHKSNEFIVCLIAVGAAMAACDGHIRDDEASHLSEFVLGASALTTPPTILEAIRKLIDQPPTFESAMLYVEKLDREVWPVIDDILAIVSEADGTVSEAEKAFLGKWADYKAAQTQGAV